MEPTDDPNQYFEDITNEKEDEAPLPKKGSPPKKGFFTNYTHFISIPLLGEDLKQKVLTYNKEILSHIEDEYKTCIRFQPPELLHISLAMLNLRNETMRNNAKEALVKAEGDIKVLLKDEPLTIKLGGLQAFSDKKYSAKNAMPKLLYVDLVKEKNTELIDKATNCIIRALMEKEVIDTDDLPAMNVTYDHTVSMFRPLVYHATFMRIKNTPEKKYDATPLIEKTKENQLGEYVVKRIDISTRLEFAEDKFFKPLYSAHLKD